MKVFFVPDWKIETVKHRTQVYINNPSDENRMMLGVAIDRLEEPELEAEIDDNPLLKLLLRKPGGESKPVELRYPGDGKE